MKITNITEKSFLLMFFPNYFTNCVAAFVSLCKGLEVILGANYGPL